MAQPFTTEPITHGQVLLKTTHGDILLELWTREAPKTCRNFVQLALEGYYDGCPFYRIIPGFLVQTGDAGDGGQTIYDQPFEDEFSQRLRFSRRGLVAMANPQKKNCNLSQFFITLDRCDSLQNKNTIFGTIVGDSLFNVVSIGDSEIKPGTDEPVYPPMIKSVEVLNNPFPDIVPRITAEEKREQEKLRKQARKQAVLDRKKSKAVKNTALLSFGEAGEEAPEEAKKFKLKSAHDVEDPASRLSSTVKDDRGLLPDMPEGMGKGLPTQEKKRVSETPAEQPKPKKSRKELIEPAEPVPAPADKKKEVQSEIAKMQADLQKLIKKPKDDSGSDSDSSTHEKSKKKKKKIDGASLLASQRSQFLSTGKASKGFALKSATSDDIGSAPKRAPKNDEDLVAVMKAFGEKIRKAEATAPPKPYDPDRPADALEEDIDDADMGWLGHRLVFRKDVTLDRHKIDEYVTVDPLNDPRKAGMTLEEAKNAEAKMRRMGMLESKDGPSRPREYRDRGDPSRNRARADDRGRGGEERPRERREYEDDRRQPGRSSGSWR